MGRHSILRLGLRFGRGPVCLHFTFGIVIWTWTGIMGTFTIWTQLRDHRHFVHVLKCCLCQEICDPWASIYIFTEPLEGIINFFSFCNHFSIILYLSITWTLGVKIQTFPALIIDVIESSLIPYKLPLYSPCSTNLKKRNQFYIIYNCSSHIEMLRSILKRCVW